MNTVDDLIQKINNYRNLEPNWDGYGGERPSESAITDSITILKRLPEHILPDRIGLASDGEISFVWDRPYIFADFGFTGGGVFTYYTNVYGSKYYGDNQRIENYHLLALSCILGEI